jgi:hypothetical protein
MKNNTENSVDTEIKKDEADAPINDSKNALKPTDHDPGSDMHTQNDSTETGQSESEVELREVYEKPKSKMIGLVAAVLILAMIIGGLYWGLSKWKQPEPLGPNLISTVAEAVSTPKTQKDAPVVTTVQPDSDSPSARLNSKIEEIENLRDELLIKQGEIAELKRYYNKAIIQVVDKILHIKTTQGIDSIQQALKNKTIGLNLQTIQRRQAYIQSLDHPTRWLDNGSEELLYLKRKIKINLRLAQITSGIDLDGLVKESEEIIKNRRLSLTNLALSTETVKRQPLKNIWNEIIQKEKQYTLNKIIPNEDKRPKQDHGFNQQKHNRIILEEICAGNYTRRNELTVLSVKAAKCLAQGKDADLFLNRISDLNPEAAKHLIQWKGNWICLNGIKELSPEVAKHLSQWKGDWISLNGIAELSFESSHYLRQWKGKQLELMGLDQKQMKYKLRVLTLLSQWEKSGGKLYIPEKLRQVIKKLDAL